MSAVVLPTDSVIDDIDLDQLFQAAVANITGLPGNMVVERFQSDPDLVPRRPEPTANWCAVAVITSESDDSPVIEVVPDDRTKVKYSDHEQLSVLASFYGPNGSRYAKLFRDGIKIPQNMWDLQANQIYFTDATRITRVPALVSQQWQNRYDLPLTFRRKIERLYPIDRFDVVQIHIFDDHPIGKSVFDRTIDLPVDPPNT